MLMGLCSHTGPLQMMRKMIGSFASKDDRSDNTILVVQLEKLIRPGDLEKRLREHVDEDVQRDCPFVSHRFSHIEPLPDEF